MTEVHTGWFWGQVQRGLERLSNFKITRYNKFKFKRDRKHFPRNIQVLHLNSDIRKQFQKLTIRDLNSRIENISLEDGENQHAETVDGNHIYTRGQIQATRDGRCWNQVKQQRG